MKEKRLKPLNVAFDKLTILGDLKSDIHIDAFAQWLEEVGFIKQEYESRNYGYKEIYRHETIGYIEFSEKAKTNETDHTRLNKSLSRIKRERETIRQYGPMEFLPSMEELNSAMDETLELLKQCDERGFLKRLKDIRFEYNPKYANYGDDKDQVATIQAQVVGKMTNKHCTQVHIAMDYNKAIQDLMFLDKKARTECVFRDKRKRNETIYMGDRSSREYLCFYDKKEENKAKGTLDQYPELEHVARFEARLKGPKLDELTNGDLNPYESVRAYDYKGQDLSQLDDEQELIVIGILYKLKKGIDPFANMTKYKKKKYREMIDTLLKTTIHLADDFQKEKSRLAKMLIDIVN